MDHVLELTKGVAQDARRHDRHRRMLHSVKTMHDMPE